MKINLIHFILFSIFIIFSLEQKLTNVKEINKTINKKLVYLEDGYYKIKAYDNFSLFNYHQNNKINNEFLIFKSVNYNEKNSGNYYIEDKKLRTILYTNMTTIIFQYYNIYNKNNYLWKLIPKINKEGKLVYYILNLKYYRFIEYNNTASDFNYKFILSNKNNIKQLTKYNEFTFERNNKSPLKSNKKLINKNKPHKAIEDLLKNIKDSNFKNEKQIFDKLKYYNNKNINSNDDNSLLKEIIDLQNYTSDTYGKELLNISEKLNKVIRISLDNQKFFERNQRKERMKINNIKQQIKIIKEQYNHNLNNTYILVITFLIVFFIFLILDYLNYKYFTL